MTQAARQATLSVPIVAAPSADPVEAGLVASLARPGGNVTGFTITTGAEVEGARLQLLKEIAPRAARIAFLGPRSVWDGPQGAVLREAARNLGIRLVEHAGDYDEAFSAIVRDRLDALFIARHPANWNNRQIIVDFAAAQRLPAIYESRESVEIGGLISYGVNLPDLYRRAAGHVDKILRGARAADIPMEQPTRFELIINLGTAKKLGITVPQMLLARADEVIE